MGKKIMFATLAAVALAVACSNGPALPTAPRPELPTAAVASGGGVTASAFDYFLRSKVEWVFDGVALTASIPNPPYDVEQKILLQVNDRGVSPQVMLGFTISKHVTRGEPISWTVADLPCGKLIEGELYVSDEPVPNDKISGGYLVAFYFGETPACSTPRPKPSPSPQCEGEQCECDVAASSEEPNPCPTPTPSPSPSPSPTPCPGDDFSTATYPNPCPTPTPSPSPTPPPQLYCYYEVSGNGKADRCVGTLGHAGDAGFWIEDSPEDHRLAHHCRFNFDGLVNNKFQLSPGISAEGCANKRDD